MVTTRMCHVEKTLCSHSDNVRAYHFLQHVLFWNKTRGLWLDRCDAHKNSSLLPLFWGCAIISTLEATELVNFPGGIPASLVKSSGHSSAAGATYQWFPVSTWSHLSWSSLQQVASRVSFTYVAWLKHYHTIFKKWMTGISTMQSGFGWTNVAVLFLLSLYPEVVLADENSTSPTSHSPLTTSTPQSRPLGWVAAPVLLLVVCVVIVMCGVWARWLYTAGERRYWGRVHNEHLQATGTASSDSIHHQTRDSSEETEDSITDSDKKGLFS